MSQIYWKKLSRLGFKMAGTPFSAKDALGVTRSVSADFSGPVLIAGYMAQTYADRVFQTFNRMVNGRFAYSLAPWITYGGDTTHSFSAATRTAGTGSALLTKFASHAGASTLTATGSILQPFTCPVPTGSVTLAVYSGMSYTIGAGTPVSTYTLKAYILNTSTGVESLVATWTSSMSATTALTWTARTVDITSYVSGGGEYVLRLEAGISDVSTGTGNATTNAYIDEVSIIA